jgi:hypothetical protein
MNDEQTYVAYLLKNKDRFGAEERLNAPGILRFEVQNLPHDDILDTNFFAEYGHKDTILVYERVDDNGGFVWEIF